MNISKQINTVLIFCFVAMLFTYSLNAQEVKSNSDIIVTGYCTVNDIKNNPKTTDWFVPEYASYETDKVVIEQLKAKDDINYTITLVLGTWCGDSKEQFPHFVKILDEIGFMYDNLNMICVDKQKLATGIDLSIYNIVKVPTIIIYVDEEEKGRIIETPAEKLETDFLNILNK